VAKAKASGADVKNPGRHTGRTTPKGIPPIGAPPAWMDPMQKKAWAAVVRELPWLKESHRMLVTMTTMLRTDLELGSISMAKMQELRRCLSQLGATPADESKVSLPDDDDDEDEGLFTPPPGGKPN
jgi:phage terminase small subunit